ncbi:hypothetical protein J3R82DRAFT_11922 [Butyriboletus roseoflavus]|nr:hypothetical protein J3R82DRAFT_11922 [Butyriboletus roseoflavus]
MRTAWSSSGSLVSDRIPAHPPPQKQQQQQNKGKGRGIQKALTPEPSKSKAVRVLEARLAGARESNGHAKDPKGGCFCQGKSHRLARSSASFVLARHAPVGLIPRTCVSLPARKHALSDYVPMCRQCGLILCTLNPPHYACPHCASALLDKRGREALVGRLERALADQIAREEAERQKAIEEARAAQGAFPTLPGSQAQLQRTSRTPPPPTTRTVLSLNSSTKKVTVSSYSTPTVTSSRPASRGQEREEEEGRVLGPLGEVRYAKEPLDPGRRWKNMRVVDVKYVPLPRGTTGDTSKQGRKKKGGERRTAAAGTDG